MSNYDVKCVLGVKAQLGECPLWSVQDQALYWEDIDGMTLNRFDPASGTNTVWRLPSAPGCFAFRDGGGAVIAARDGVYDLDFASGALKRLADAPFDSAVCRFNDGKTDRQGRLWVGSFPADFQNAEMDGKGVLWRYDGRRFENVGPITIPNGITFSADGRTMYRAESMTREIFVYDFDTEAGALANQRLFAKVPDSLGFPDGATLDAEGGYWVALPGPDKGGIGRYTPEGELDLFIETPVHAPTMPAFGGPDLSTLYFTSVGAAHMPGFEPGPMDGNLFAVETRFKGLPETNFKPSR